MRLRHGLPARTPPTAPPGAGPLRRRHEILRLHSAFLTMTGYKQVRSITAALAGDMESADRAELTLPETGVCGGTGLFDDPSAGEADGDGCCAPAPHPAQL
nr:FAD dependent oxidoreductase domain-containing protein [Streptomyces sp. F8]